MSNPERLDINLCDKSTHQD